MLPQFDDMLKTLVGEPSVSSLSPDIDRSNLAVIEHLANWAEGLGFETELQTLPDAPKKGNLIATLPANAAPEDGNDERGGLVLAGHTDTVPYDEDKWQSDPFTITENDGLLYGLGACDMKGFFPTALEAITPFLTAKRTAPITIIACGTSLSMPCGPRALMSM